MDPELKRLEKEYKEKRSKLKKAGSLGSFRPVVIARQAKKDKIDKFKTEEKKAKIKKKAEKLSNLLSLNDPDYIEFLLDKNDISEEQFANNFKAGMYPKLRSSPYGQPYGQSHIYNQSQENKDNLSDILPAILETLRSDKRTTKKSELSNLLPLLSELKIDTPSKGMYANVITDYSKPNSTMMRRNDDLAEKMAKYSQLSNQYDISSSKFKNRLDMLSDIWGNEVGMNKKERRTEFKPFLREMMPIMEDPNPEFDTPYDNENIRKQRLRNTAYSNRGLSNYFNPGRRRQISTYSI